MGHVCLHNGRFEDAARVFQEAYDHAHRLGAPLWAARAARHLALACVWYDPDRAARALPHARQLNQSLEEHVGLAQCDMAEGLSRAFLGDPTAAAVLVARARAGFEAAGATYELLPVEPVEILVGIATGRDVQACEGARRLVDAVHRGQPLGPPSWAAVASLWANLPEAADFDRVGWLDAADAKVRWRGVLDRATGTG
ncbi:hypothetical protein ACWGR4_14075 [Embleya sp. NPDC055664]